MMHKLRFIALRVMLALFASSMLFHILVLLGVIPTTIVWGGRFADTEEIYGLELFSFILNGLLLLFTLSNMEVWIKPLPKLINKGLLAVFGLLFLLNTIGNFMAMTSIERYVFTPITSILFMCFAMLFFTKNSHVQ